METETLVLVLIFSFGVSVFLILYLTGKRLKEDRITEKRVKRIIQRIEQDRGKEGDVSL